MDLKQLSDEFQKSWINIKSMLDQTQDELRIQGEVIANLINQNQEQEQVIKRLIDERY